MFRRESLRGQSMRGRVLPAFGMGEIVPADLYTQIAQAFGLPAPASAPQALTLDALLLPLAQTAAGQQAIDQTINTLLDSPQLTAYLRDRAIAVLWDRYKVEIILFTALALGGAFYIGRQSVSREQRS